MQQKGKEIISVMETYLTKVYVWSMLLVTGAITCAGVSFLGLKALGFYESVSWTGIGIFVFTDIVYVAGGIWLIRKTIRNGRLQQDMFRFGKIYLCVILTIQYNFILYLIPTREFWGYIFFFIILTALFLDVKMTLVFTILMVLSYITGLFVRWRVILPVQDGFFVTEVFLRTVGLVLSLFSINLFTWFVSEFLANAKRDELEQKQNQAQNVLESAAGIGGHLQATSAKVMEAAEGQSSATEQLSAIMGELTKMSQRLLENSRKNMGHLSELNNMSENVSLKIEQISEMSRNLVELSGENESDMNRLLEGSSVVVAANEDTSRSVRRLLDGTGQVARTLELIGQIASSTNLLALNASIEAARAGESGRGFAVVAGEIGGLANNTQESLREISQLMAELEQDAAQVSDSIRTSSAKLNEQNDVMKETVNKVKYMIDMLSSCLEAIEQVYEDNIQQKQLVSETNESNEQMQEQIEMQDQRFREISHVVSDSAQAMTGLASQVDELDSIIQQMTELLN